jgi:hypothetical protein
MGSLRCEKCNEIRWVCVRHRESVQASATA